MRKSESGKADGRELQNKLFVSANFNILTPIVILLIFCQGCISFSAAQSISQHAHPNAHAHNDYEHENPLWDALQSGFISVEADVHLRKNALWVSHEKPAKHAQTLEQLYLHPLDSLISTHALYPGNENQFLLMIDVKTKAVPTYESIQLAVLRYPQLLCSAESCPVKIFISGNRAIELILSDTITGMALDGRPSDLGKGMPSEKMPVVSDRYSNWSTWSGRGKPTGNELVRILELANRVHAEGKKLRLWAIPDNELAWSVLLDAGVDLINTDDLEGLHRYFLSRDL